MSILTKPLLKKSTLSDELEQPNRIAEDQIRQRKPELAAQIAELARIPIEQAEHELTLFEEGHRDHRDLLTARYGNEIPTEVHPHRIGAIMPGNAPILYYLVAYRILNSGHQVDFKPKTDGGDHVLENVMDIYNTAYGDGSVRITPFSSNDENSVRDFFGAHPIVYMFTASPFYEKALRRLEPSGLDGRLVGFVEGDSTVYVHEDADIQRAAQMAIDSVTEGNGQYCKNTGVELVHGYIFDKYLKKREGLNGKLAVGEPLDRGINLVELDGSHKSTRRDLLRNARNSGLDVRKVGRNGPYLIVAAGGPEHFPENMIGEFNVPGAFLIPVTDEYDALEMIRRRGKITSRGRILDLGVASEIDINREFEKQDVAAHVHPLYQPTTRADIFARHDYDPRTGLGHWMMPIIEGDKVYD